MKQKLFTLLTLLVLCVTGAWADSKEFVAGTGTGQINVSSGSGSANVSSTPVTINVNAPGGKTQARQIWKDGGTAKNEQAFQMGSNAGSTPTSKYIEVTVSEGYKITGLTIRGAANGTSATTYTAYCWAGEFSTAAGAVIGTGEFAFPNYNGSDDGANISMSSIAEGTRTIRIYKQVKYDSSTKTIDGSKGSNTPSSSPSNVNIAKITVTYEATSSATMLSSPEISATASGTVTIGAVTNATKITYTTDGTNPTTSSTTYIEPFDVADGTTVKAIAIGDGTNYNNSNVATKVVYYTGIKVATPVIKTYNGSVGITCTTPNATIQYSTDDGTTWATYARTFTLAADATVKAKATRTDCTDSDVASEDVEVVSNGWNKTIYLPYTLFNVGKREGTDENNLLTGKTGTAAEGYSIAITGRDDKELQSGSNITVNGTSMQSMKVSNGAQNTLTIPAGVTVKGITFYSYNNYTDPTYVHGWKEVNGTSYQDSSSDSYYGNIPLQGNSNFTDYLTNPDSRTYSINNITDGGTITFTNAGNQICYLIGVHIVAPEYTVTYYGNGNDEGTAPTDEDSPYAEGTQVTVLGAGTLAKNGAVFTGWNTEADGSGTGYAAGAKFNITANTELYAQYNVVTGTAIIKATLTGAKAATVTGTIGGTADVNVYAPDPDSGNGCKFGGSSNYVGITLSAGTFLTGDIINVHTTRTAQQGTIIIYDSDKSTILYNTGTVGNGTAGAVENQDNKFVMPAAINGKSTLYVCRTSSNNWNGYVDFIEVSRPNATIKLNASGYATYSAASDFTVTGAKAYKAALNTTDNKITCTEVDAVPAGAGVLLFGEANAAVSIVTTTGAAALADNDLKGTTKADGTLAAKEGGKFYYSLSGNTFKKFTGDAFIANKAYFASGSDLSLSAKAFTIVFDGETTGINGIEEVAPVTKTRKVVKNGRLVIETANGEYSVSGARVK